MMNSIVLILQIIVLLSLLSLIISADENSSIDIIPSIWPLPNLFKYGTLSLSVSSLSFITINNNNKVNINTLNQGYQHYNNIIFKHNINTATTATITKVIVNVDDISEDYPQYNTDESYELIITDDDGIIINSKTVYGSLRALESLSQLIRYDFDSKTYLVASPILVKDKPRYNHRGILLDTSRHFQPVAFIKHVIDSLSYAKLNVFHWHVVDTQSFPFESITYPKLWKGSYTPSERYSSEDIADIVEYGRLRAVKVMIEFDMPGHAGSWCAGYPEICPSTTCLQPLDPSNENTFKLIESLLGECTGFKKGSGIFPYDFLHLGGDEVDYSCWEGSENIQNWAEQNNLADSEAIYEYFVDKAASIARSQDRTPIQWVEVYEHFKDKLSNDTIVHIWKEKTTLTNVLVDGYRAILSDQDVWYLDHLDVSWESFYLNEPTAGLPTEVDQSLILGGEACMWGEKVDPSDIFATIWPRAAAFSERVWTSQHIIGSEADFWLNHDEVEARLEQFRCLLHERAVGAAPVTNAQARESPSSPGSCFIQRRKV